MTSSPVSWTCPAVTFLQKWAVQVLLPYLQIKFGPWNMAVSLEWVVLFSLTLQMNNLDPSTKYLLWTVCGSWCADTVTLKEYQLLGVNWLNLLYRSNLSSILADEMGTYR